MNNIKDATTSNLQETRIKIKKQLLMEIYNPSIKINKKLVNELKEVTQELRSRIQTLKLNH